MHSLVVNDETNLLRLITLWLDNNYQIKSKRATTTFSQTFRELNTPIVEPAGQRSRRNCVVSIIVGPDRTELMISSAGLVESPDGS